MTISDKGLCMIKQFEGLRLIAYKATPQEKYYTIGYGHYGPDVKSGQTVTPDQAEAMLMLDLYTFEDAVAALPYKFNQNEFDALVSFAYNCGVGNLRKLTDGGRRDKQTIAEKMLLYCKASGKTMEGLKKRRQAEHDHFLSNKEDLKDLQNFLNDHGAALTVDGIYGPKSRAALKDYIGRCGYEY